MFKFKLTLVALLLFVLASALAPTARAQVFRTFVSADGKDVGLCDTPEKACREIQAGEGRAHAR